MELQSQEFFNNISMIYEYSHKKMPESKDTKHVYW